MLENKLTENLPNRISATANPARSLPSTNHMSEVRQLSRATPFLKDIHDPSPPQHASRAGDPAAATVEITRSDMLKRRTIRWSGMAAEFVQSTGQDRIDFRFRAPMHLLVVYERGIRREGETFVEGVPMSTLRNVGRKLTFVPAGREYSEWHKPRAPAHLMYFYFDPSRLPVLSDLGVDESSLAARLYFEDATLWQTALKLKALLEAPTLENKLYSEALGQVLLHELAAMNRETPRVRAQQRGGLAAWQQRIVTAYLDDHLAEQIPLATLAQLARLSPYYFCRAFKRSFGMPPHRYHNYRRIERAQDMLAQDPASVTEIGLTVGFAEASSFTAAFRKATGMTPSGYRRSLE